MTDNLLNINIPPNLWVDVYSLINLPIGTPISIENVGDSDIFLAVQASQPDPDHDAYNIIKRNGGSLRNSVGNSGSWAFSQGFTGKLQIRPVVPRKGFFANGDIEKDFLTEVALSNIPGYQSRSIVMRNPSVGTTFQDIWGEGGSLIYPTAAESWEILSDNNNDTVGGSGAQTVLVNYLDVNYEQKFTIVNLSGQTPVILTPTDFFRPDGAVVILSGSSEFNLGKITIRVAGGGNVRQVILPTFSTSEDTHYTVPAGKQLLALLVSPFFTKNNDGFIRGKVRVFGTNTLVTTGNFPFYQNAFSINFKALFPIREKSDLFFQARSANTGVEVNMVLEFLVVDNRL